MKSTIQWWGIKAQLKYSQICYPIKKALKQLDVRKLYNS